MSIKEWIDQKMMAYTYSGILFIHKKDAILVNVVSWLILEKNKWKESGTKFKCYMISVIWLFQNKFICRNRKQIGCYQDLRKENGMWLLVNIALKKNNENSLRLDRDGN